MLSFPLLLQRLRQEYLDGFQIQGDMIAQEQQFQLQQSCLLLKVRVEEPDSI